MPENLVGTSETLRIVSFESEQKFNEWLAGLIDGDGCYRWRMSKEEYMLNMLQYFKQNPIFSNKKIRIQLVKLFFLLKFLKAHRATENTTPHLKNRWLTLKTAWFKR